MTDQKEPKILFNEHFAVSKKTLDDYGAFNMSLITDLPLFIDPFLLFNSKNETYQKLHTGIIRYLRFLKDKSSTTQQVDKGLLREWYQFKEVEQNWLGFSERGNKGRGLGHDFAKALNANLHTVFQDFGNEVITKGSHLERLCLIKDGVGRDNISDFTTNLIKEFLLEYTQRFAREHVNEKQCGEFAIEKVRFNYNTESWERVTYYLPKFNMDFVLLTPKDILTKDENWINKNDLIEDFYQIPNAIPDDSLRAQVNNYFRKALPKKPKNKDEHEAAFKTIQEFPVLIDYFIKYKEEHGDRAQDVSDQKVKFSEKLYGQQFTSFVDLLARHTDFYKKGDTYDEVKERLWFFKDVIEKNNGYKSLYVDGQPIKSENDVHILFRFVWYATPSDVNGDTTPSLAGYKVSRGAADRTTVEFKLARNKFLKKNLQKRLELQKDTNGIQKSFCVVICFTREELNKVNSILDELGLSGVEDIMLIDARSTEQSEYIANSKISQTDSTPVSTPREETVAGDLGSFSDGTIRYKNDIIDLRPQIKDLCRLFLEHPKHVLNHDDIKDKIVEAAKRGSTSYATIAKYVSELHRALKIHFKRDVIFNSNQDGWYFDTTKR